MEIGINACYKQSVQQNIEIRCGGTDRQTDIGQLSWWQQWMKVYEISCHGMSAVSRVQSSVETISQVLWMFWEDNSTWTLQINPFPQHSLPDKLWTMDRPFRYTSISVPEISQCCFQNYYQIDFGTLVDHFSTYCILMRKLTDLYMLVVSTGL